MSYSSTVAPLHDKNAYGTSEARSDIVLALPSLKPPVEIPVIELILK